MSEAASGVEVAQGAQKDTGEQEQEAAAEPGGASKTTFSSAGAKPPVAPSTREAAAPSASDQAFGPADRKAPEGKDPQARFRAAVAKGDPAAIAIAGKSPAAIAALIAKDPALGAEYFTIVEANRSDPEPLRALFPHLTVADKRKLFSAQFGFAVVDRPASFHHQEAAFQPDQIDKMYEAAQLLPPSHMTNNPRFKKLEAGNSARFIHQQDTIEMPGQQEASTGDKTALYGKAFRHEVGHAVDFALGDKTNKLRDEFGWHVVKEDDYETLAPHLEVLGIMTPGLSSKERVDLARAIVGSVGLDDAFIQTMLVSFIGYKPAEAKTLIARGVDPEWKKRQAAFFDKGVTIGDQHYFGAGFGMGGWAYRVNKATYDAAPPTGKVSHYEWFAEWYATYYATPDHAGVSGRLNEFFRDEVDPFNQQRSALGAAEATDGLSGETPKFA